MPTTYEVNAGDTLPKIAVAHGFRKWETIWEDAANASLRNERNDPRVLHPKDIVKIPDKQRKQVGCATEKHHVFKVPSMTEKLRIRVEQGPGEPMRSKKYRLTIPGAEYEGTTTNDGLIEHDIPVTADVGLLEVEGCRWPLQIGHLNPVDERTDDARISGAQARLNNLGFGAGAVTGEMNDQTRDAVKAFQGEKWPDRTPNGELNDETCQALKERHGT